MRRVGQFAAVIGGLAAVAQLATAALLAWLCGSWLVTDYGRIAGLGHLLDALAVLLYVVPFVALTATGWLGLWAALAALQGRGGAHLGVAASLAATALALVAIGHTAPWVIPLTTVLVLASLAAAGCWAAGRGRRLAAP